MAAIAALTALLKSPIILALLAALGWVANNFRAEIHQWLKDLFKRNKAKEIEERD